MSKNRINEHAWSHHLETKRKTRILLEFIVSTTPISLSRQPRFPSPTDDQNGILGVKGLRQQFKKKISSLANAVATKSLSVYRSYVLEETTEKKNKQ